MHHRRTQPAHDLEQRVGFPNREQIEQIFQQGKSRTGQIVRNLTKDINIFSAQFDRRLGKIGTGADRNNDMFRAMPSKGERELMPVTFGR